MFQCSNLLTKCSHIIAYPICSGYTSSGKVIFACRRK